MNYEIKFNGETGKTYSVMPIADSLSLADWLTLRVAMTEEASPNEGQYAGTVDTDVATRWALFESATQPTDWSSIICEFDLTDEVTSVNVSALNDLSQAEAEAAVEAATFSTSQFAAVALAAAALDATPVGKRLVNKVTLTSTGTGAATQVIYDDDGVTALKTQLVTDDGTTQTQGAAS